MEKTYRPGDYDREVAAEEQEHALRKQLDQPCRFCMQKIAATAEFCEEHIDQPPGFYNIN